MATAAGVFVNTAFGYLRAEVLLFVATASGTGVVRGMTGEELVTFAFVSQGFLVVIGAFGDRELAQRVATGDIVIDLYRPTDLQAWWLANWLGRSWFQVLARGVPPVLLGAIAFDLVWPHPWVWLPFACSLLLATIVGFALRFCANLSAFWLLDNRGVDQMVTVLISFFAGMLLPVNLFPPWLKTVAHALPFVALVQYPTEIYLGLHSGSGMVLVLGRQLLWAVVLLAVGRIMLVAATRRVVIQGG
jgi:ABC-2 type transport system permease protein